MRTIISLPIILLLLLFGATPSRSELPLLIPREVLFGNSLKRDPQISPDGRHLSYLAADKSNVMQIWVRSLAGNDDRQLTTEERRSIQHYTWSYNDGHLIFARETDGDENWQLLTVNITSGALRNLTPYKGVKSLLLRMDPTHPRSLLVAMNLRNRRLFDVYRIDVQTGETRMVHRNGGRQIGWVPDSEMRVNIATTFAGIIIRDEQRLPWRTLRPWKRAERGMFIGLSRDDKTLYIRGITGEDAGAVLALDVSTGKETVLVQDPKYDVEDVFVHPVKREVQAVGFYKDKLQWQVLDPNIAEDFEFLSKLRTGQFSVLHPPYESPIVYSRNLGRRDLQDETWIVSYESDDSPVHHYLYKRNSKTAALLFSENPSLEKYRLSNMRPISYKSRDDLEIHGYLTLPPGIAAENLPTLLYVHGGPYSRDRWGYYNVIQWLANRGYAVLQVNYRGSAGYGRKFTLASYKEWGGKMHDDLIDGVNWLINSGISNPQKIAIMGGSYGGYATLVGLTLTPGVFAAGVSTVGISNLISFYNNYPVSWSLAKPLFKVRIGDPEKEEDFLKSRSPLFHVDKIQSPLLIAHGINDARVVASESEQMVAAMRNADKPVEYVTYGDEGHRQWRFENKLDFYEKVEKFLAAHLGGRYEPARDARSHGDLGSKIDRPVDANQMLK